MSAPRITFQKLMQALRGRELKIHSNILNVPADVTDTVTILPRLQSQTGTNLSKFKTEMAIQKFSIVIACSTLCC